MKEKWHVHVQYDTYTLIFWTNLQII